MTGCHANTWDEAREGETGLCVHFRGCKLGVVLAPAEAMSEGPWEVFKVTVLGIWMLTVALEQGDGLLTLKCLCMPAYMHAVCIHVCA